VGQPTILVTNDDGINSRGIWAVVQAVMSLGKVVVVAPDRQWSGSGRSMPSSVTCEVREVACRNRELDVQAYAVDANPAQTVMLGVLDLCGKRPDLVVSGVNHGFNLGTDVTLSGTVGAALEAAAFGIPALAASLEMDLRCYFDGDQNADYGGTMHFVRALARYILSIGLPRGVDILNLNLPSNTSATTPWYLTRLSRSRYFLPQPSSPEDRRRLVGWSVLEDASGLDPQTDIYTLLTRRAVSITPLTIDMTAAAPAGREAEMGQDLARYLGEEDSPLSERRTNGRTQDKAQ
jgi:5'-nucleotidase